MVSINIRLADGKTFAVTVEGSESTILQLKTEVGPKLSPPADAASIKIVFKGRLPKDEETLGSVGEYFRQHSSTPSSNEGC
jgi:hypothetical protein